MLRFSRMDRKNSDLKPFIKYFLELTVTPKPCAEGSSPSALPHIPYKAINLGDKTAPVIKNELQNFIERTDIKVWMNGHFHSGCVIDDIKFGKKKRLLPLNIQKMAKLKQSTHHLNDWMFKYEKILLIL